jgi:hypothetical protein
MPNEGFDGNLIQLKLVVSFGGLILGKNDNRVSIVKA